MITAHISYADGHKASVSLDKGKNTFGTGIECDVVLPKSEALGGTFAVHCSEEGATVEVGQQVMLAVQNRSGATTVLAPSHPFLLSAGDVLKLDGILIALRGITWSARPASAPRRSAARTVLRRSLFASSVPILCGAMYWTVWTGLDAKAISATALQSVTRGEEGQEQVQQPEMTEADIMALLTANGIGPDTIMPQGDGYAASFFVADPAQRDALSETLAALSVNVTPRIFMDSEILEAVRLSMSLANKEAAEITVRNGVVHMSGAPSDEAWRKDLIDMLERDNISLKSISFSGQSEKWKSEIDAKIVAVWAGRNPYLVLSDGGQVRPGQEVIGGVTLVSMKDENTLLVSVNGNHQEYVMK